MNGDERPLAARIATFGLVATGPLLAEPLGDPEWQALLGEASIHRMEGLLAAAVEEGALPVSAGQLEDLRRAARSRASMDLLAERETVVTATVLERSGIPYRVLKGPAWAHSSYPDPMLRSFGDVDVLVPAKQWEQSVQALEASGAERLFPELRPGFDVRFGKDATYVAASGWEIDLHRTLAVGPYGFWIDSEALFARPAAEISLGGCDLPVLDPVAAYLHACYNAVLGDDPPRLPALRDVAQMGNEGSLDPDEVWSLAAGWRAVNVVRRALLLVSDRLGPDLTGAVAKRFAGEVSGFDRLLLASYRGAGRGYTAQLAGAVALRGWRSRWAYLSALARPQDSYLAARGFSLKGFVRYGLRKARRSV